MLRQIQAGEDDRPYKTYKNRIVFARNCVHCQSEFWPKRSDHKYCSSSCRVLACRKRKGYVYQGGRYHKPVTTAAPTMEGLLLQYFKPQEQKFSWNNVGESALGSAAVSGLKYMAHDLPLMQKMDKVLQHLEGKNAIHATVNKYSLQYLGLHKLANGTIALFKDLKSGKLLAQDEHGKWMKQANDQSERWEVIKR